MSTIGLRDSMAGCGVYRFAESCSSGAKGSSYAVSGCRTGREAPLWALTPTFAFLLLLLSLTALPVGLFCRPSPLGGKFVASSRRLCSSALKTSPAVGAHESSSRDDMVWIGEFSILVLRSEYEGGSMAASSRTGDTTSARPPKELLAHSRKGESEPGELFLAPLLGVPMLMELSGLRMFLPCWAPTTPGLLSADEARFLALDRLALSFVSDSGCLGGFPELACALRRGFGACGVRKGDDMLRPSTCGQAHLEAFICMYTSHRAASNAPLSTHLGPLALPRHTQHPGALTCGAGCTRARRTRHRAPVTRSPREGGGSPPPLRLEFAGDRQLLANCCGARGGVGYKGCGSPRARMCGATQARRGRDESTRHRCPRPRAGRELSGVMRSLWPEPAQKVSNTKPKLD